MKARYEQYQQQMDIYSWKNIDDWDYNTCKICGYDVMRLGDTFTFSALSSYYGDDLTCNEILMENILK